MRRVAAILSVLAVSVMASAQTQAWEKLVAPGLTYRMEIDLSKPLVIHALRWTPGSGAIRARAETGPATLFGPTRPKDTLGSAVKRTQAIAAINGDFATADGAPLGCMLRDGELISLPEPGRSAFCWGPGMATVTPLGSKASFKAGATETPVLHLNRSAEANDLALQTSAAGYSLSSAPATHVILSVSGFLRPGVDAVGTVKRIESGQTAVKLDQGEWALAATGTQMAAVGTLKVGDQVTINASISGVDLFTVRNVIGGGPGLLKDGKPTLDLVKEQFSNAFANDRHPRSAAGSGPDGDIWLVTVDGRSPMSRGATLAELTEIMQNLGCTEAVNLDGGGSAAVSVMGLTLNRPSDGDERYLANGLMLFGDLPTPVGGDMVVRGTPTLVMGQPFTFSVVDQNGETIPTGEILWAARGGAWIDQAGTLRPLKAGECTVYANVRGKVLSIRVNVVEAS